MLDVSSPSPPRKTRQLLEVSPELLGQLLTASEAATLVGVSMAEIRKWASCGHLVAVDEDARGRPLFRWIDVARAERFTRDHARRKYITDA